MRIGIYGGSFNPLHFGHIGLAQWVVEHTDLEEVWLMVSPNNPLKDSRILANEQERWQAAQKAVEGIPGLRASDFEFHLPRPSYTAHTMRALTAAYPEHTFTLLIGEDNLSILPKWREWEWLTTQFRIYVYPRHGKQEATLPTVLTNNKQIIRLEGAPYFDISSTDIREGKKKL